MDVRKYEIYFKCWTGYLTRDLQTPMNCSVYYINK